MAGLKQNEKKSEPITKKVADIFLRGVGSFMSIPVLIGRGIRAIFDRINKPVVPISLVAPVASTLATPSVESKELPKALKIVLVGKAGSGKTALARRYVEGSFSSALDLERSQVGAHSFSKAIKAKKKDAAHSSQIRLDIWDFAGGDASAASNSIYYKGAQASMVVYDSKTSLEEIQQWVAELRKEAPDRIIMLVGSDKSGELVVVSEQLEAYVEREGLLHQKASAKTGVGVDEAFNALAQEILQKKHQAELEFKPSAPRREDSSSAFPEPAPHSQPALSSSLSPGRSGSVAGVSEAVGSDLLSPSASLSPDQEEERGRRPSSS